MGSVHYSGEFWLLDLIQEFKELMTFIYLPHSNSRSLLQQSLTLPGAPEDRCPPKCGKTELELPFLAEMGLYHLCSAGVSGKIYQPGAIGLSPRLQSGLCFVCQLCPFLQ